MTDFLNTADDTDKVPNAAANQPLYRSYKHSAREWTLLQLVLNVINESARVQQAFSSDKNPSITKIFRAFLSFRERWMKLLDDPQYAALHSAISKGVEKIKKYEAVAKCTAVNVISLSPIQSLLTVDFFAYKSNSFKPCCEEYLPGSVGRGR